MSEPLRADPEPTMGIVASFMDRRVGAELDERGVLVWYDPTRTWQPWIQSARGESSPGEATAIPVTICGRDAHLVVGTGSYYEVLQACTPLVSGSEPSRLLVYVPGESYQETLSPLRELECLGGEKEPYRRDLSQIARQAFHVAGLSESKIDELLNRDGLDFAYLDSISVGDASASPLTPIFGTSRELDVFPSFLAEPQRRAKAAAKGLLAEVARMASQGLGLTLGADADAETMAQDLARALLVAEMRSDLDGPEPVEISQIREPESDEQVDRVRAVCRRLRREYPEAYEVLADTVETELGLAQAQIDPETLGRIDTFRFEESRLLEACDRRLAAGEAERAQSIVNGRLGQDSFWASVARYPARHAAWEAAGDLARLALTLDAVENDVERAGDGPQRWVKSYTRAEGWHVADQIFRQARYRLASLEDDGDLATGAAHIFGRYDALVARMASGFVEKLKSAQWSVTGVCQQTEIFEKHIRPVDGACAYFLVDALRFEMGSELAALVERLGSESIQLWPAIAAVPTITPIGMAALLPKAEQSFQIAESSGRVYGSVDGAALSGSAARMDFAKGEVPGLVDVTLDEVVYGLGPKKLKAQVESARILVVRSQEIDQVGESVTTTIAQKIMGTIMEDVRKAVIRLSRAGIRRFLITADHGHLFGERRGDDMKIDPPQGGSKVELHRRCWVGRGGNTPSSCVRVPAREFGYSSDLEFVFPTGTGVFKAGGGRTYHHGGLSLQELVIPVLTFDLVTQDVKGKSAGDIIVLEGVPKAITNRIFSLTIRNTQLVERQVRLLAVDAQDRRTVGQVAFVASEGWDSTDRTVTLTSGESVSVGLQLDDDGSRELRVVVVEVGTERTMKDTSPIPVELIG